MINNANITLLTGRLTAEPELRTNDKGTLYLFGSVAVQRNFKGSDGNYGTDFINFSANGTTADFIAKHFHKGDPLMMSGSLRARTAKIAVGNEEKNINQLSVAVEQVCFVPGAAKSGNGNAAQQQGAPAAQGNAAAAPQQTPMAQPDFTPIPSDGDFPFGSGDDDGLPF